MFAAAALAAAGCREAPPRPDAPRPRIVTFSPALTQIVFDMGLGGHVVAVTTQCILPPGQPRKRVGDAFNLNAESIVWARPQVLLVQSKVEKFATVRRLDPGIRIEHFQIESLADIRRAIERIGRIVGQPKLAAEAAERFDAKVAAIRGRVAGAPRPRVLFALGHMNPSVPGAGTFIGDMIELAGGINAGDPGRPHKRWRNPALEEISVAAPDVIVCQADSGQDSEARRYWLSRTELPAAKTRRIHVVTDRRWTIPSTYSVTLAGELAEMIHPAAPGGGPER